MNYKKLIVEWFQSHRNLNKGDMINLYRIIKEQTMLFPIEVVYFSIKDVERNVDWIENNRTMTNGAFVSYIFTCASSKYEVNYKIFTTKEKKSENIELDILNNDDKPKVKGRDISKFLK